MAVDPWAPATDQLDAASSRQAEERMRRRRGCSRRGRARRGRTRRWRSTSSSRSPMSLGSLGALGPVGWEEVGRVVPSMDVVVMVFCVHTEPNFSLPWQRKRQYSSSSSGFVISGRRVLTNAHSVEHFTQVKLKKRGSDTKYLATVLAIGTDKWSKWIPNTLNVLSNVSFLFVGLAGLILCHYKNYFRLWLLDMAFIRYSSIVIFRWTAIEVQKENHIVVPWTAIELSEFLQGNRGAGVPGACGGCNPGRWSSWSSWGRRSAGGIEALEFLEFLGPAICGSRRPAGELLLLEAGDLRQPAAGELLLLGAICYCRGTIGRPQQRISSRGGDARPQRRIDVRPQQWIDRELPAADQQRRW